MPVPRRVWLISLALGWRFVRARFSPAARAKSRSSGQSLKTKQSPFTQATGSSVRFSPSNHIIFYKSHIHEIGNTDHEGSGTPLFARHSPRASALLDVIAHIAAASWWPPTIVCTQLPQFAALLTA